jgi:hypothetical protein
MFLQKLFLKYNTLGEPKCRFDVYVSSFKVDYFGKLMVY